MATIIRSSLLAVGDTLSSKATEDILNEYDSFSGDSDCGTSFKRFAKGY